MSNRKPLTYSPAAERFFQAARVALPSFPKADDDEVAEWMDGDAVLGHVRASLLALHAADGWLRDYPTLAPLLAVIESVLERDDDPYVRDMIISGFFEDFQSRLVRTGGRRELARVRLHLGPESQKVWDPLVRELGSGSDRR